MTAIAALTLADGQATPVSHTFGVVGINASNVARWADRSGGIQVGYPTVSLLVKEPIKGNPNYKVSAKVTLPVLEQTSASTATGIQPAPTKAYELTSTMDFTLPARSTLQNRKDLFAYVKNLMANAIMTAAIENYEPQY